MRSLLEDWGAGAVRVREAGSVALFLDFDGTLVPLRDDPCAVILSRPARAVLMRLAKNPTVRVCIISGRRLADLCAQVGIPGIHYLGVHGGEGDDVDLPPGVERIVAGARRKFASRLNGSRGISVPGISIEDKRVAFSVHYRRALAEEVAHARELLDEIVQKHAGALRVVPGDQVWEVLPREIRGKGHAARSEWRLRSAGALPIYIGNDGTDESAFGTLASGLTASVGAARLTRAHYSLRNPAEVARFLELLDEEMRT